MKSKKNKSFSYFGVTFEGYLTSFKTLTYFPFKFTRFLNTRAYNQPFFETSLGTVCDAIVNEYRIKRNCSRLPNIVRNPSTLASTKWTLGSRSCKLFPINLRKYPIRKLTILLLMNFQSYFSEPEFDSEYHHQHIHKSKVRLY